MPTEDYTLSLIRKYVKNSQDAALRGDPSAYIELYKNRDESIAVLKKHFEEFSGTDRFWLYALTFMLLGVDGHDDFIRTQYPIEKDPACRRMLEARKRPAMNRQSKILELVMNSMTRKLLNLEP